MKIITDASGKMGEIANQCVLECGCFGNAIPLTAYQSFLKDIFLLILIIPIAIAAFRNKIQLNDPNTSMILYTGALVLTFLFGYMMLDWIFPVLYLTFLLLAASMVRRRVNHPKVEWLMAISVVLVAGLVQIKTITDLPLKDYRPYAVGESITKNRLSADEIGLDAPVYASEYSFKNIKTGLDTIVLSSDYLKIYNDDSFVSTYKIVSYEGAEVKISDGYEPRIMDLIMENASGDDLTDEILSNKGYTFFYISKDLDAVAEAGAPGQDEFNGLAEAVQKEGITFYGLTNSGADFNSAFATEHSAPYEFLTCDQIELKIVIRSNPGLVLIKEGVVVGKWSWRDIPTFSEFVNLP
jgi:hypothetical protein